MVPRSVWIAFGLLCLLSATAWVVPYAGEQLPGLERQGLLFGAVGLAALCFTGCRQVVRAGWRLAVAGVGFFGLPILIVEAARGSVGEISRSALFAMVPVVVVLVIVTGSTAGGARRLLIPALVGLGGLLLLLPLDFSTSMRGQAMLGLISAAVVVVGVCSVWLFRVLDGMELPEAAAGIGLANALFLLVCGAVRGELVWNWSGLASVASLSSLVDVVEIVLIVWLLREMPPARFAARYLLIPLVTIVESFIVMRPQWTARMGFGTMLLAVGAAALLLLKDVDEDAVLSFR
jgi:drug/metabolite transporter (DMT)-like permease